MQYTNHGPINKNTMPACFYDTYQCVFDTIETETQYKRIIDSSLLFEFEVYYQLRENYKVYNPPEQRKKSMLLVQVLDPQEYLDNNPDFERFGWQGIDVLGDRTSKYSFWAEYWCEYWAKNYNKFETDVELKFDKDFKKYLMYNRKPLHHRVMAVDQLEKGNLLNDGYVTLADQLTLPMPDTEEVLLFSDGGSKIKSDPTIGDMHIWNHAFVNVISETSMEGTFMSEKTFKPIVGKRPFISFNKERTQRLIDVGFKTFGNFWDENLDWYKQVDFICRQDVETLKGWWESYEMQDILEHNKMHFWSTYQAINKQFLYDFLKK